MEAQRAGRRRRAPGTAAAALALALAGAVAMVASGCGGDASSGAATGATGATSTGSATGTTTGTGTTPGQSAVVRTYRDPFGDVTPGEPDLTAVRISNDARTIHLEFQFAGAPPLSASAKEGWTDMLLMGIDVPPIGSKPTPGGWMGLDYALGMHGIAPRAVFRDMHAEGPQVATLPSRISGSTITIDLPRARIGNPAWFDFNVAVGREGGDEIGGASGGGDIIPATGTARYRLSTAGA